MTTVSPAIFTPVVAAPRAKDSTATTPDAPEQAFGHVLAREMDRQDTGTSTQADTEKSDTSATEATAKTTEESTAEEMVQPQQTSVSPWISMLQTAITPPPVQPTPVDTLLRDTALASDDPNLLILATQSAQLSGGILPTNALKMPPAPTAPNTTESIAITSKNTTITPSSTTNLSALMANSTAETGKNLPMMMANPTAETGKNLPAMMTNSTAETGKGLPLIINMPLTEQPTGEIIEISHELPPLGSTTLFTDPFIAQSDEIITDLFSLQGAQNASLPQSAPQIASQTSVKDNVQVAQHTISEPVGNARWGDAVAQHVSLMLGKNEQHMEMQLNPPHLGPMEVRLTMGGEQASVVFTSQNAGVREALSVAIPRLTALLADQGIQLTNVQVASDSLNQQAQDQTRQQNAFNNRSDGRKESSAFELENSGTRRVLTGITMPVARSGVSLYV